ncbi:MAG: glycosyltransferase [Blastocatellia bacterium]
MVSNIGRIIFQILAWPFRDDRDNQGNYLKDGISALVCCKDEEYSLKFCLESLTHVADQIICVDNGSTDKTLQIMEEFKEGNADGKDITVIDAKGLNLAEARNLGLMHVSRKWLLNCGGDFVFHTTGELDAKELFSKLTRTWLRKSFRFGHVNLWGDLNHTTRLFSVYAVGEYYLVRFNRKVEFVEHGRFDYVKFPRQHLRLEIDKAVFFHLNSLKSDSRLMYRNCYFDWRETLSQKSNGDQEPQGLTDFKWFENKWQRERFNTNDERSVKFRFQRQMAVAHYIKYDPSRYGDYPEVLQRALPGDSGRFSVIYWDGEPITRIDKEDQEMLGYQPTQEDLKWDPKRYLRRILNEAECQKLGI